MPSKYSHAFVLSHCDNRALLDDDSRQSLTSAAGAAPSASHSRSSPLPIRLANPKTFTPPHSRSTSATDSISTVSSFASSRLASSVVTEIYAPESDDPLEQIFYHHPRSSLATTPKRTSPPKTTSGLRLSPRSPPNKSPSAANITPRFTPTTNRNSFDFARPISTISEKPTEEEELYIHRNDVDEDNISLSSLSTLSSFSSFLTYGAPPDDSRPLQLQAPASISRLSPPYTPPSLEESRRSSSRGSSTDDAVPPPIARTRRATEYDNYPERSVNNNNKTRSRSVSKTRRLSFLKPFTSSSSHHNHNHKYNPAHSNSNSDASFTATNNRSSSTYAPTATTTYRSSTTYAPSAAASLSPHPPSQPTASATIAPTVASSSRSFNPSTQRWRASEYSIEGLLTEEEIQRLKRKGVNPQLKAEMDNATRGRKFGPLVGNTFIG
ncbi:hypothetical protein MMC24_006712 [Lignoscripta atroalba]|nr:hypothetical protein [Lignoscripta atroalba]